MPDDSAPLDRLFRPRSVAVVGASRRPGSIGRQVLANLVAHGFEGAVHPVNPNAEAVHSIRAHPDLVSIPDPVDLAVVVVPAVRVADVLRDGVAKGIGGAVIISAGFGETGPEGVAREEEVARVAREGGVRIVGPNCMGIANTEAGVRMNATFAAAEPIPGNLAFLTQSGALGEAILDQARELGVGISMFASIGNRADVAPVDLLAYFADDPRCRGILMYLESFGGPREFWRVARDVARETPVICVKGGRTEAGARAAASHTGAIVASDAATDALFDQAGIVRVTTIDEMFAIGSAVAAGVDPGGSRVGIVTNAGGPGILAADACAGLDLEVEPLAPETEDRLREALPPEASVENPIDLVAGADPARYRVALETVLPDPTIDALVAICVPPMMVNAEAVAREIARVASPDASDGAGPAVPVLACFMGRGPGAGIDVLHEAGIPVYPFPEPAALALSALVRHRRHRERPVGEVPSFPDVDREAARTLLEEVRGDGRTVLRTEEAEELVAAYGIPVARTRSVETADAAMEAAEETGFPVVLKGIPRAGAHKSERGLVRLDLRDPNEVRVAWKELAADLGDGGEIRVQPYLAGARETVIGLAADPVFGPVAVFGLGGIFVEVLRAVSMRLVPLTDVDAREMVREIPGREILEGVRGQDGVDDDLLADVLLRMAAIARDHPGLRELEINPFLADPDPARCRAVDVRGALRDA